MVEPTEKSGLKDDKALIFETSEEVEIYPTFDSMGLREELLRGMINVAK
jgi:hypothetical protein